jgi:hypothetical protein
MAATMKETWRWGEVGAERSASDPLLPHLARIVRRALRRSNDLSPLARAVRAAAAQIDPGSYVASNSAEEIRVHYLARRLSALLAPDFRDAPGRDAHKETVGA